MKRKIKVTHKNPSRRKLVLFLLLILTLALILIVLIYDKSKKAQNVSTSDKSIKLKTDRIMNQNPQKTSSQSSAAKSTNKGNSNTYTTQDEILADLEVNAPLGTQQSIQHTDLEYRIPSTYVKLPFTTFLKNNEKSDLSKNLSPITLYGKESMMQEVDPYRFYGTPHFFVFSEISPLTPQQWAADHVSYQGKKWDASYNTGTEVSINNRIFFSISVMCCGAYEQLYIYQYKGALVIFGTSDYYADASYGTDQWTNGKSSDRNVILDAVARSIRSNK